MVFVITSSYNSILCVSLKKLKKNDSKSQLLAFTRKLCGCRKKMQTKKNENLLKFTVRTTATSAQYEVRDKSHSGLAHFCQLPADKNLNWLIM